MPQIPDSVKEILREDLTEKGMQAWWERYVFLDPFAQEGHACEHARTWIGKLHKHGGAMPQAPAIFLFGFDDPHDDGGLSVWLVAEPYFREEGFVNDSSTASSVIPPSKREEIDDDEAEQLIDQADDWLRKATNGILGGEGMESCWETGWLTDDDRKMHQRLYGEDRDKFEGKTREQAIEEIKQKLIERGFKYEPKLEENG
jgi:hypothetical protein